jgi:hypothetical protein
VSGIIAELLTENTTTPLIWYSKHHHTLGHNLVLGLIKFNTPDPKAIPGSVIAIQMFGDFLGFNSHLHVLISDGCFHENGMLTISPAIYKQ